MSSFYVAEDRQFLSGEKWYSSGNVCVKVLSTEKFGAGRFDSFVKYVYEHSPENICQKDVWDFQNRFTHSEDNYGHTR